MTPRAAPGERREHAVLETRQRVITAARELILAGKLSRLSLGEVARRAAVARATVYYRFGSKRGLLEAVVDNALSRADGRALVAAYHHPDPVAATRAVLREVARFWAAEFAVFQQLLALAALDPDLRATLAGHTGAREAILWGLVRRLEDAGRLRPGVEASQAFDSLWLLTSFAAFRELHLVRGLDPSAVAERLITLAGAVVDLEPERRS
ncbi:MAG: TetR family transcriptional regulator [Dehalococcoidia bacterium]|nr:MAG: TetR family transcriptional regulator [Dehalococcoidia bacterium]